MNAYPLLVVFLLYPIDSNTLYFIVIHVLIVDYLLNTMLLCAYAHLNCIAFDGPHLSFLWGSSHIQHIAHQ